MKYGRSCCLLSSPIWRAAVPRWLRSLRISSSRLLILDRQSSRFMGAPEARRSRNPMQYRRKLPPTQVIEGGQLRVRQRTVAAGAQLAEPQRTELHALEAIHGVAERLAVAL